MVYCNGKRLKRFGIVNVYVEEIKKFLRYTGWHKLGPIGVLFVFVKALPYTPKTLLPDKLHFMHLSSGPPISPNC